MEQHPALAKLERLARGGLWSYDIVADRLEWSEGARSLLAPDQAAPINLSRTLAICVEPSRTHLRHALERAMIDGSPIDLDVELEPLLGRARRLRFTGTVQLQKRRPVRIDGCLVDLGERQRLEDENRRLREDLRGLSRLDGLTGLPNLSALDPAVAALRVNGRGASGDCALFYFDVDRFKLVNDTCGHAEGDRMLHELSKVLRGLLRPDDVLIRIGGDEFVAIVGDCAGRKALARANQLIAEVAEHRFIADGYAYPLGVTIGMAPIDGDITNSDLLLSHAGTACYVAKHRGGGRAHLYQRSDEGVTGARRDMTAAARLEAAIENNQIELYGQRIVPLERGALPSYEVLIRVREPDGSITTPGALLGAAQRFGLMSRLERHVVRDVLGKLAALPEDGYRGWAHVSVNLSGSSIADPQFADFLLHELVLHDVPAQRLHFEITETSAVNEDEGARALIARLRGRGHKVLLDDFGTGFTSFNYFKTLGVDGIKIDCSYTANLAHDETNRAIVESLCRLGSRLGLEIIAEGVDNEAALAILSQLGVRHIQGWLFHKAEPLDTVLRDSLKLSA